MKKHILIIISIILISCNDGRKLRYKQGDIVTFKLTGTKAIITSTDDFLSDYQIQVEDNYHSIIVHRCEDYELN